MSDEEEPIALKVRAEKLAEIEPSQIDCEMIDARTRKVLLYLVNQEIKKLTRMPQKFAATQLAEMEGIKAGLNACKRIRTKKEETASDEEGFHYHI